MKVKSHFLSSALFLILTSLLLVPALGQTKEDSWSGRHKMRRATLVKELKLSPDKAKDFNAVGDKYAKDRQELIERLKKSQAELQNALAAATYFQRTRNLYHCKACGYQASLTAGTVFHKTRTPLHKWFWMIWLMRRQKSGISMLSLQRMLEIKTYKTVWTMGHKIRQAMAARDANYKLAGLIEMDDTYFGAPKPGKRGRGAAGKAKVVVAVETPADKPRFAAMRLVPRVSSAEIQPLVKERLAAEAVIKTDGWQGYSFLDTSPDLQHEWLVPGSGKEAPKVLPWVHTLIANIKGNIRGIHHGVSPKHLPRYLGEFCYRFNRRFWEPQMFNRMIHACVNSAAITFSELRA